MTSETPDGHDMVGWSKHWVVDVNVLVAGAKAKTLSDGVDEASVGSPHTGGSETPMGVASGDEAEVEQWTTGVEDSRMEEEDEVEADTQGRVDRQTSFLSKPENTELLHLALNTIKRFKMANIFRANIHKKLKFNIFD